MVFVVQKIVAAFENCLNKQTFINAWGFKRLVPDFIKKYYVHNYLCAKIVPAITLKAEILKRYSLA